MLAVSRLALSAIGEQRCFFMSERSFLLIFSLILPPGKPLIITAIVADDGAKRPDYLSPYIFSSHGN